MGLGGGGKRAVGVAEGGLGDLHVVVDTEAFDAMGDGVVTFDGETGACGADVEGGAAGGAGEAGGLEGGGHGFGVVRECFCGVAEAAQVVDFFDSSEGESFGFVGPGVARQADTSGGEAFCGAFALGGDRIALGLNCGAVGADFRNQHSGGIAVNAESRCCLLVGIAVAEEALGEEAFLVGGKSGNKGECHGLGGF